MLAFSLSFQIGQLHPDPLLLLSPAKFYAENLYNFCRFIDRGDKTRNSVLMFINCLGLTWGQGWRQRGGSQLFHHRCYHTGPSNSAMKAQRTNWWGGGIFSVIWQEFLELCFVILAWARGTVFRNIFRFYPLFEVLYFAPVQQFGCEVNCSFILQWPWLYFVAEEKRHLGFLI